MSSSLIRLESFEKKYPTEHETVEQLRGFISRVHSGDEFTIHELMGEIEPQSSKAFAKLLAILVTDGVLQPFIRVYSNRRSGLADFAIDQKLPDEVFDFTSDIKIPVSDENVETVYRIREIPEHLAR